MTACYRCCCCCCCLWCCCCSCRRRGITTARRRRRRCCCCWHRRRGRRARERLWCRVGLRPKTAPHSSTWRHAFWVALSVSKRPREKKPCRRPARRMREQTQRRRARRGCLFSSLSSNQGYRDCCAGRLACVRIKPINAAVWPC
jgi:hypothetical protein